MMELDGVLPVDKPEGPTSHDVVAIARRALRTRRIGHTGTLDPFASGLLLLCLGPATRVAEYLTALPKSYLATIRLGEATRTDDLTGEVVQRSDAWRSLDEARVREALADQTGRIAQLPPAFSAKKVAGERMYAAARRGEEVRRTPVEVTVHAIELLRFEPPELEISVDCGSGTYIRAIARDVGEALGVGGHLTRLRRTRVGEHRVGDALALDLLEDPERVRAALLPAAAALSHLPQLRVDADQARVIAHGGWVPAPVGTPEGGPIALVDERRALLAIVERRGDRIQPRKVFA
jgi:tRNA pseudouridine55 synthase